MGHSGCSIVNSALRACNGARNPRCSFARALRGKSGITILPSRLGICSEKVVLLTISSKQLSDNKKEELDTDIRMTQQEFESLDDATLIWRCVEPSIREVRGKDPNTKSQAMKQLSGSQRALFLFQVLYGHAGNGVSAFFAQIAYLAESLDFWTGLQSAMKFFCDEEMLRVIEEFEHMYCMARQSQPVSPQELAELDQMYSARIPATLHRIAMYIRNHPAEFIAFGEN